MTATLIDRVPVMRAQHSCVVPEVGGRHLDFRAELGGDLPRAGTLQLHQLVGAGLHRVRNPVEHLRTLRTRPPCPPWLGRHSRGHGPADIAAAEPAAISSPGSRVAGSPGPAWAGTHRSPAARPCRRSSGHGGPARQPSFRSSARSATGNDLTTRMGIVSVGIQLASVACENGLLVECKLSFRKTKTIQQLTIRQGVHPVVRAAAAAGAGAAELRDPQPVGRRSRRGGKVRCRHA